MHFFLMSYIHIDATGMEWDKRTHGQGNLGCLQGLYNANAQC